MKALTAREITARKFSEDVETRFRAVLDQSHEALFLIEIGSWRFIDVNNTACISLGYSKNELLELTIPEIDPFFPAEKLKKSLQQLRKEPHNLLGPVESVHRTKDERHIPVEITVKLTKVKGREILMAIARDITERKRAEQALRESEQRFRKIFEEGPLGMAIVGSNFKLFKVNKALCDMLGYTEQELTDRTFVDITYPEDVEKDIHLAKQVFKGEIASYKLEKRFIKKNREILWINLTATGIRGEDGKVLYGLGMVEDITERKRVEQALRESEERYRQLVENTPNPIFSVNRKGIIQMWNRACEKVFQYGQEIIGQKYQTLLRNPENGAAIEAMLAQVFQEKTHSDVDITYRCKDGTDRYMVSRLYPVHDHAGKVQGCVFANTDLTKRKQAEEAHRQAERRYKDLFEEAPVMYVITRNQNGVPIVADCNELFLSTLGYNRTEVLGQPLADFYAPGSKSELLEGGGYQKALEGHFNTQERQLITRDGHVVETLLRAVPETDSNGSVTGTRAMYVDITERKHAEEALRESEEKFRSLAEKSPNMIFINRKGKIVYVNEKCEEIMGYSKEEFYSPDFDFMKLIAPECRNLVIENFRLHLKGEEIPPYEYAVITKDGKRIEAIHTTRLIKYEGESAILGIITDITERKQAEEALRQSEEKYRTLFEESKDTVYISTPEGKILDINPAGVELFGYASKEELLQVDIAQDLYFNPEDRKLFQHTLEQNGFVKDYEFVLKRRDGQKLFVLETATAVRDEHGKIVAYRGIIHDLTKRRKLEEQLLQAQKMETIGTLAGGVAHDFNNLLTVILGNTEFGMQDSKPNDPVFRDLRRIEKTAIQARDLISQLLSFSRRQVLNPKILNLNKTIEELYKILKRTIGEDIDLVTKLDPKLVPVWADPGQIKQVLMNLCINARDAMPQGGLLSIETQNITAEQVKALTAIKNKSTNYGQITIKDTGVGMNKKTLARIFEPFFTTKEVGKGTGLGLSVVYGIVKQHEGHIEVFSEEGKGATFKIYFPAISESEVAAHREKKVPYILGKGETILVVEDDKTVRNVTVRMLSRLGYTVLTAQNGKEAMKVFETEREEVDLVIMDVVMPKLGGPQTYEKMRQIKPNLAVIFVTGYDIRAEIEDLGYQEQEPIAMLRKPYSKDTLGQKVRELLGR